MEQLGFDDDAKLWAGALFETLEESDAIDEYSSYYDSYQPSYGGTALTPAMFSMDRNSVTRSIFPASLIPTQKIATTLRHTPFRHGRTTGVMFGALTEMS